MEDRKPVVAMSWAMQQNTQEKAQKFAQELLSLLKKENQVEKILFPSMGMIYPVAHVLKGTEIAIGAQNIAPVAHGFYSGEYSVESLVDIQGKYVELGHWERRKLFHETEEAINQKVRLALDKNVTPILCVGELAENGNVQMVYDYIYRQLWNDLYKVASQKSTEIIIAYTPMWAVGKSRASNVPHIHEVGTFIRQTIVEFFGEKAGNNVRIIYGGSVSPENARLIVRNENIDGVLVGRFGSEPARFAEVVHVVAENNHKKFDF